MMLLRRLLAKFGPIFLVVAVQGALLTGPKVVAQEGPPSDLETLYVAINNPVALTLNPEGLGRVTTPLCGNPRRILLFTSTLQVRAFATLPDLVKENSEDILCYEHKIVVSPAVEDITSPGAAGYPTPNPAGYRSHEFYVTTRGVAPAGDSSGTGPRIFKIALDLNALINRQVVRYLAPALFATLPSSCARNATTGLAFDKQSSWGFNLLAVCTNSTGSGGAVFSVNPSGALTKVANISGFPGPFDHPDVALTGPSAGDLFIPAKNAPLFCDSTGCTPPPAGRVLRVSPSEGISSAFAYANVPSAKAVAFIADRKCNFGLPNSVAPQSATYFKTKFPATPGGNRVDFIPKPPFAGLSGQLAVLSQNAEGGIGIWTVTGARFGVATPFSASSATLFDATFVECFVPTFVHLTITGRGTGTLDVAIHSIPGRFDASKVNFPQSILTTISTNSQNHPTGLCTRGEKGKERAKTKDDDDRAKLKKANDEGKKGDDNGGGGDDEENEGTFHCPFLPPPGSSAQDFLVWKGPTENDPEGGC